MHKIRRTKQFCELTHGRSRRDDQNIFADADNSATYGYGSSTAIDSKNLTDFKILNSVQKFVKE
jgi:hypothetical protein